MNLNIMAVRLTGSPERRRTESYRNVQAQLGGLAIFGGKGANGRSEGR